MDAVLGRLNLQRGEAVMLGTKFGLIGLMCVLSEALDYCGAWQYATLQAVGVTDVIPARCAFLLRAALSSLAGLLWGFGRSQYFKWDSRATDKGTVACAAHLIERQAKSDRAAEAASDKDSADDDAHDNDSEAGDPSFVGPAAAADETPDVPRRSQRLLRRAQRRCLFPAASPPPDHGDSGGAGGSAWNLDYGWKRVEGFVLSWGLAILPALFNLTPPALRHKLEYSRFYSRPMLALACCLACAGEQLAQVNLRKAMKKRNWRWPTISRHLKSDSSEHTFRRDIAIPLAVYAGTAIFVVAFTRSHLEPASLAIGLECDKYSSYCDRLPARRHYVDATAGGALHSTGPNLTALDATTAATLSCKALDPGPINATLLATTVNANCPTGPHAHGRPQAPPPSKPHRHVYCPAANITWWSWVPASYDIHVTGGAAYPQSGSMRARVDICFDASCLFYSPWFWLIVCLGGGIVTLVVDTKDNDSTQYGTHMIGVTAFVAAAIMIASLDGAHLFIRAVLAINLIPYLHVFFKASTHFKTLKKGREKEKERARFALISFFSECKLVFRVFEIMLFAGFTLTMPATRAEAVLLFGGTLVGLVVFFIATIVNIPVIKTR